MAKDSDAGNPVPKTWTGGISNILKQTKEMTEEVKAQIGEQDKLAKLQEAKNRALDLIAHNNSEINRQNLENIQKIEQALASGKLTDKQIENRMLEVSESLEFVSASFEQMAQAADNDETRNALLQLAKSQSRELEIHATKELSKEVTASLKNLGGLFGASHDETTLMLKEAVMTANENLQRAIEDGDHEKIQLAKSQLQESQSGIEKEMELREKRKADEESNSLLLKTATGISMLGDKFEGIAKGITSKVGFFAKLIPIALLILSQVDRDKFIIVFEKLKDAILNIVEVVRGIGDILKGNIEEGVLKLRDNIGTVAGLIIGLGLFFAGPIVKVITLISKGLVFLYKGLTIFAKVLTGIGKVLVGIVKIVGFKFILIGGTIAAGVYGLYKLFKFISEKLQLDSVKDLIFIALAGLQDGLGRVANFFIDIVNGITGFISRVGNRVLRFFNIDFELPDMQIEKLATDNAERAIEESQQRRIQRELEEANRAQREDLEPTSVMPTSFNIDPDLLMPDMANMTGMDLDAFSIENLDLNRSMGMMGATNNIVSAPVMSTQDNRNNVTTVIQQPSSRTSALMSNYAFSR